MNQRVEIERQTRDQIWFQISSPLWCWSKDLWAQGQDRGREHIWRRVLEQTREDTDGSKHSD
jgi:hypothetical protein